MPDLEKAIRIFEGNYKNFVLRSNREVITVTDVIALLKEREPVAPMLTNGHTGSPIWICGNCKSWVGDKTVSYCWHCGRKVKWE